LANNVSVNAVVRRYCCRILSEDRVRVFEFLRDLIACRDWYERDSRPKCVLSKDEVCDNQFSVCRVAGGGANVYAVFVYVYDADFIGFLPFNSFLFTFLGTSCTLS